MPEGALRLVDAYELVVRDASLLDYETHSFIQVTVVSKDSGQPSMQITHTLRIPIENVNEPPNRITMTSPDGGDRLHVREDAKAGTNIGNIKVFDPDSGPQYFFCTLPVGDYDEDIPFQHAGSDGWNAHTQDYNYVEVSVQGVLDYETMPQYNLSVLCFDAGGLVRIEYFMIYVDDSNEPARGVLVSSYLDKQAINGESPNLQQLLEQDWQIQNSVVTRPETPGQAWDHDGVIVAYMYVVDEDNLNDKTQQHTITVIPEEEYKKGTCSYLV